jgi:hypothetical protein
MELAKGAVQNLTPVENVSKAFGKLKTNIAVALAVAPQAQAKTA